MAGRRKERSGFLGSTVVTVIKLKNGELKTAVATEHHLPLRTGRGVLEICECHYGLGSPDTFLRLGTLRDRLAKET